MADRWNSGSDAAYIKPRLIPDYALQGRDDSGGPEFDPYTQAFGDGGVVTGAKAHLSASGGSDDPMDGDELSDAKRSAGAMKGGKLSKAGSDGPASSAAMQRK